MTRARHLPIAAALAGALLGLPSWGVRAEQADRSKPTQIEADRMSADDARRISIFEGNVVLSKGTISVIDGPYAESKELLGGFAMLE